MRRSAPQLFLPTLTLAVAAPLLSGCYPIALPSEEEANARPQWQREFGYFSGGLIAYAGRAVDGGARQLAVLMSAYW